MAKIAHGSQSRGMIATEYLLVGLQDKIKLLLSFVELAGNRQQHRETVAQVKHRGIIILPINQGKVQ